MAGMVAKINVLNIAASKISSIATSTMATKRINHSNVVYHNNQYYQHTPWQRGIIKSREILKEIRAQFLLITTEQIML